MANTEDYLDSLLNGIKDKDKSKQTDGLKGEASPESKPSFLDEFEASLNLTEDSSTLSSEEKDFLAEFEREIGVDTDIPHKESFDSPKVSSKTSVTVDAEDDILSELSDILDFGIESDSLDDIPTDINVGKDEFKTRSELIDTDTPKEEPSGSGVALEDTDDDGALRDIDEESNVSEVSEESSSALTDTEPVSSALSDIEDDDDKETSTETAETPKGEGGTEESEFSDEEVLDIKDLLDSIDEEGKIKAETETEVSLTDETGQATDEDEDNKSEEEVKKGGIFGIIAGILAKFKKEKKDGDEEESQEEETEEEAGEEIDPKEAKRLKKEQKQKEKEEKKKKAKEEKAAKDAKKAEKPPKEKKPKKAKVKDNSPKIPIISIIFFVLLAASIVVLWMVLKNTISHQTSIRSANSSFDRGNYVESYRQMSGLDELKLSEEEALLLNRAKHMAYLQYRWDHYQDLKEREEYIKALDTLVKAGIYYLDHIEDAQALAIYDRYTEKGRQIMDELYMVYNMTDTDVVDIVNLRVRKEYTKALFLVLERQGLWSYE